MKRTNSATWQEFRGRWRILVQKDGVRKSFYSSIAGRNGQREANRKADAWLDDNIIDSNKKIFEISEMYIEQLQESTGKSHWLQYKGYFKNHINPEIGNIKIDNLTEQHFQSIINKCFKKGLSKKMLINIRACLANFLKYCRKSNLCTHRFEELPIPKTAKASKKTILTPDEINILMSVDSRIVKEKNIFEPLVYAFRFAVLTGLRPSELLGLQWNDIDNNNRLIIKRGINNYSEITDGKNENANRIFQLNEFQIEILNLLKKYCYDNKINSEYLFTNKGAFLSQQLLLQRWKKYCISNNITPISMYELRHTFVSIIKALPEGKIKSMVGHSKNMDTYGVYSHDFGNDLAETSMMINDTFKALIN